jgi:hypothetical protein
MNLDERITRIELRRRGSGPLGAARAVMADHDGVIVACVVDPPAPPAGSLAAMYERLEHRSRDTCPDAAECEDADRCRAAGLNSPDG